MKIQLRKLVNPNILNRGWIGFFGDSEYVKEDGNLKYGYWSLTTIIENKDEIESIEKNYGIFSLDDEVDETEIQNNNMDFPIWNDKGQLCAVQFLYGGN